MVRTPSPVPAPNYRFVDPALFPEKDTPIAQAAVHLKQVWTPYDVTVIPGRHVLDGMPTPPRVLNKTGGALSDADAQAMAWAEYRESALVGWLEGAGQVGLNDHLRAHGLFNGVIGDAVRQGHLVTNPACDLYAVTFTVIPVDASISAFEAGRGYTVTAPYALVETYTAATCSVVTDQGSVLFSFHNATGIETGTVRHDDVLGDVFYAESGRTCEVGAADQPAVCNGAP